MTSSELFWIFTAIYKSFPSWIIPISIYTLLVLDELKISLKSDDPLLFIPSIIILAAFSADKEERFGDVYL